MMALVSIEEKVSNMVQMPEYPYGDERIGPMIEVAEYSEHEVVVRDADWDEADVVADVEIFVKAEANTKEYVKDKNVSEAELMEVVGSNDKGSFVIYESFMSMSPEEKASIFEFDKILSIDEVHRRVSSFLRDIKSDVNENEIMDVAQIVYKGMRANFIKQHTEEIVKAIKFMDLSYPCLVDNEKAELFQFLPDDNNYNLERHIAVLKACGLKLEFDEVYEDY